MEKTSHLKHSPGCPCDFTQPSDEHVRMINLAAQKHYNIVDMNSIDVRRRIL